MDVIPYDWRKFFPPVAEKLCTCKKLANTDTRDSEMVKLAKEVFGEEDEIVKPEYLENGIDPFSFIYTLSIKGAYEQRKKCAKILLGDERSSIITDEEYPHALRRNLFHLYGKRCKPENSTLKKERAVLDRLWLLFRDGCQVKEYAHIEDGDERIWQMIKDISGVGLANLTQTLFLINPRVFLRIDNRTLHLSADKAICRMSEDQMRRLIKNGKLQFSYVHVMESLHKPFPGCLPYEISRLGYLVKKGKLKIQPNYWLISSQATGGDNGDFWDKKTFKETRKKDTQNDEKKRLFREENCVWTGRDRDKQGGKYPVTKPKSGDIMLCRKNTQEVHGIGIITDNGYSSGWKGGAYISVIWITAKQEKLVKPITGVRRALVPGDKYKNDYEKIYPETFELLERLLKIKEMKQDQKNLILTGPPGTGKTRLAKQLAAWLCIKGNEVDGSPLLHWLQDNVEDEEWEEMIGKFKDPAYESQMELVQFHPSYNYEDFVRGIVARTDEGKITYEVRDKILAKLAKRAKEKSDKPYVLIIDEINRANLSSVLGELIYALEYRGEPVQALYPIPEDPEQDEGQPKGDAVPTQEDPEQDKGQPKGDAETDEPEPTQKNAGENDDAKKNGDTDPNDDHTLIIPHNLYIIGTMNTADRSVGVIDYAIRRRFIFRKVLSNKEIIKVPSDKEKASNDQDNVAVKLYEEIEKIFADHLSDEFNQDDMMIGHSYFIPRDVENTTDLGLRLEYEIKPLLEEYVRDGILLEEHVGDDNPTDKDRKTKKASEKIKELKTS